MRNSAHCLWPLAAPTIAPHPVATPSPPADPPALDVGCGGHPPGLLAVSHVPQNKPYQTKSNRRITRPAAATPHCTCTATMFTLPIKAPIKAKTPVIVHDQGISRHPQKNHHAPWTLGAWNFIGAWRLELGASPHPLCAVASLRLCVKPNPQPPIKASIKAKTPAIVHDQGSSRQPVNMLKAVPQTEFGRTIGATVNGTTPPPAVIPTLALSLQRLALRSKTPAIKANRASSRQTRILWDHHPASSSGSPPLR